MKRSNVLIIEFTQQLPVGNAKTEYVAIYNDTVISEAAVRDLIKSGGWIFPNDSVIFITKEQYKNVFGPVPQSN